MFFGQPWIEVVKIIQSKELSVFSISWIRLIGCIFGDREFIGKKWFSRLARNKIDFAFRIKPNTLIETCSNDRFRSPAYSFFRKLKNKHKKLLRSQL